MATKNITMRRKIEGVIYDLMVQTTTAQVYDEDTNKTLAAIIAELTESISSAASSDDLAALTAKFDNLVTDAPEAYDTLVEISEYIATHTDEYSALMALVEGKVDAEDGKGLSTNDFTDELLAKLSALYTKSEIDDLLAALETKIDTIQSGGVDISAANVSYSNSTYTNVQDALDALLYEDLTITFTSTSSTTNEIGTSLSNIVFNWTYSKDVVSQSFNGTDLADITLRTYTYVGPISSSTTFTLKANDGTNDFSKTLTFNFYYRVYYGAATVPDEYDSDFVLGLSSSKLCASKSSVGSITVDADSGYYIYYAQPASWTEPTFNIGGFDTTFELAATFDHTNASGYTASYSVYKSGQAGLGSTTMKVS